MSALKNGCENGQKDEIETETSDWLIRRVENICLFICLYL